MTIQNSQKMHELPEVPRGNVCYPAALDCIVDRHDVPESLYLEQARRHGKRGGDEIRDYLRRLALAGTGAEVNGESIFCETLYTVDENPFTDDNIPEIYQPQTQHSFLHDLITQGLERQKAEFYIGLDNALSKNFKVLVEIDDGHIAGLQQQEEDRFILRTSFGGQVRESKPYSLGDIAGTSKIEYGFDDIEFDESVGAWLPVPWVHIADELYSPSFTVFPAET